MSSKILVSQQEKEAVNNNDQIVNENNKQLQLQKSLICVMYKRIVNRLQNKWYHSYS